jgi:hypothetical protein
MSNNNNHQDHYSIKPSTFNADKFKYWKDRIESFFLGYDVIWEMITNGYTLHVDANGVKLERSAMSDQQKKDSTNHYKARTILLNTISYN